MMSAFMTAFSYLMNIYQNVISWVFQAPLDVGISLGWFGVCSFLLVLVVKYVVRG